MAADVYYCVVEGGSLREAFNAVSQYVQREQEVLGKASHLTIDEHCAVSGAAMLSAHHDSKAYCVVKLQTVCRVEAVLEYAVEPQAAAEEGNEEG